MPRSAPILILRIGLGHPNLKCEVVIYGGVISWLGVVTSCLALLSVFMPSWQSPGCSYDQRVVSIFWISTFPKMTNFSLKYVSASLGTHGGHFCFLLFTDDMSPVAPIWINVVITTKSLKHVLTAVVILISAESVTRIIPDFSVVSWVCVQKPKLN